MRFVTDNLCDMTRAPLDPARCDCIGSRVCHVTATQRAWRGVRELCRYRLTARLLLWYGWTSPWMSHMRKVRWGCPEGRSWRKCSTPDRKCDHSNRISDGRQDRHDRGRGGTFRTHSPSEWQRVRAADRATGVSMRTSMGAYHLLFDWRLFDDAISEFRKVIADDVHCLCDQKLHGVSESAIWFGLQQVRKT